MKNLIAYWSFDDSTAKDFSGNGYHGTIIHNPQPVIGYNGHKTAMRFTGKGDFITVPYNYTSLSQIGDFILLPRIPFENFPNFTISMWVNEEGFSIPGGEAYLWFGYWNDGWLGILNHNNQFGTQITSNFTVGGVQTNFVIYENFDFSRRNKWMYFVMVYQSGILYAYLNGRLINQMAMNVNISTNDGCIACHWWNYQGNRISARFTGSIDEVMIFREALSPCDIESLYRKMNNIDTIFNICTNGTAILKGDSSAISYLWSTGSKSPFVTVSDTGSYTVIQRFQSGCQDTLSFHVNRTSPPQISSSFDDPCNSSLATLTASSGFVSYKWFHLQDSLLVATNQSFLTKIEGDYFVVAQSANSCTFASIPINIKFNLSDRPHILGDSLFCPGDTITLTANKKNAHYLWSTGDTTASIRVSTTGKYKVLAFYSPNCIDSAEMQINARKIPELKLSMKYNNGDYCNSDSAIVSASGGFQSYIWHRIPDSSVVGNKQSIITPKSGTFYAEAITNEGCKTASSIIEVIVRNNPKLEIKGENVFCDGDSINLFSSVNGSKIWWSTGDSGLSIKVTKAGKYKVFVVRSVICIDSAEIDVKVNPVPILDFTIDYANGFCNTDSAVLKASNGCYRYCWVKMPENRIVGTMQTYSTDSAGLYYVYAYTSDSCKTKSVIKELKLNKSANLAIQGQTIFCPGDTISLSIDPKYHGIHWSTGDTSHQIRVSKEAVYSVNILKDNGCPDSCSIKVVQAVVPVLKINSKDYLFNCIVDSTGLFSNPGFSSYKWYRSSNDTLVSNSQNTFVNQKGNYYLVATTKDGCRVKSDSITVKLQNYINTVSLVSIDNRKPINFDSVSLLNHTIRKVLVKNNSDKIYYLKDLFLAHNLAFSVPESQFPRTIAPYDSVALEVFYQPSVLHSLERDTIILADSCNNFSMPLVAYSLRAEYASPSSCEIPANFNIEQYWSGRRLLVSLPYPNPATEAISFSLYNPNKEDISVEIFNIFNTKLISLHTKSHGESAFHQLKLDISFLSAGFYYSIIRCNGSIDKFGFVVLK